MYKQKLVCKVSQRLFMKSFITDSLCVGKECPSHHIYENKSSAVAEMGDRGHNRHGPKRGGVLCPFRGSWDPV